jgi:RNA polymerase sigma factor (sigma-70 family)
MSVFHQHIYPIRHKLYRFALRITGNTHEAEDVVQDVLTRAWKNSESEQIQNWEAWCMTLTRNRSLDKSRSTASRRLTPIDSITPAQHGSEEFNTHAEYRDLADYAKRFMQELPEKQRLVMHLRDVEEQRYEEIAQLLDMSLDQVKVNLHRARKTIREKMNALT